MSIPGETPLDIHPQPPKAPRGKLGGANNPWGWASHRGLGSGRHRDPVVNYTLEWTPIPGDHPSQPAARVAAERRTTMSYENQLDDEGNVRNAWVAEYLNYICDVQALDPPPADMVEDIARHLSKLDIGTNWTPEFIGDAVVKMAIMWSVGGKRREYALTGKVGAV